MRKTFTLETKTISEGLYAGCITIDTAEILAHVAALEVAKKDRHEDGARFTVFVDGDSFDFKTVKKLDQFLQNIASGAKCEVFRNADKGVTVNFEI